MTPERQGEKKCKQTVDDLLKLYTIVDERKLSDALPRFVAEDLSRVPSVTSYSTNMLAMAKNLEVLEQRMKKVEQFMTKSALETACRTSDSPCELSDVLLNSYWLNFYTKRTRQLLVHVLMLAQT